MNSVARIGIIGDYDGRPSHLATEGAIYDSAAELRLEVETEWIQTDILNSGVEAILSGFDGIWCAPGSPYHSMVGAVNGIAFARVHNIPFIGTCGGFQHAVIELARNVMEKEEALKEDFDPYLPNSFITALSCSLIGQTRHIHINHSWIESIYKTSEIEEKYNCSFGLNKEFLSELNHIGFETAGTDEEGEVRIMMLEKNRFFVGSLFQPQLSSTKEHPHPLITAYLASVDEYRRSR